MTKGQAREQLGFLELVLLNTYAVRVDPVDGSWYRAWTARATDESYSTNRVRFGHGTTEAEALQSLEETAREEVAMHALTVTIAKRMAAG